MLTQAISKMLFSFLKKDNRHQVIVIALLFLLTACDSRSQLTRVPEEGTILAFGDSLTSGVGTTKLQSYPAVLNRLSGREVINAGVSGETTTQGLTRLKSELTQHNPDLVILMEGGNDIMRNHDFRQTRNNLAQMIELIKSKGIDVVLVGIPEKKLFSDSAPFYSELAEKYGLVFESDLISSLLTKSQYKSDQVHFNAAGYEQLASSLYRLLKQNGAF